MANIFAGQYRILALILSTLCISIMQSNFLTFNFTVICMTEEHYRWDDFTINFGTDIFQRVNFDPPHLRPDPSDERSSASLPDFEIPGIKVPEAGFNWQTYQLARNNFPLFLRILQRVAKEVTHRTAKRLGESVSETASRGIDFRRFINGFNFTDYDPNVVYEVKKYVLNRVRTIQQSIDLVDAKGRKLQKWTNYTTINDVELHNITWNGVINGRVRVVDRPADITYTTGEKAALFGSIAIGALLAIFPVYKGIQRYGCRKTFAVVGLISAVATASVPAAAYTSFWLFLFVRILQGIGFAICMPAVGSVTSAWATISENGLFNGALTSGIQIAPLITMPISGVMCSVFESWETVYYIHALLTLLLIILWWFVYRDVPSESDWVTIQEQRRIENGKVVDFSKKHSAIPYKRIYNNQAVWAVWVAAFGNMACIQMLIMYAPTYFKYVLNYPMLAVGFVAALPTCIQFIVKIGAGILSDQFVKLGDTAKVRLFNSIAFFGQGFFLILLAIIPASEWPEVGAFLFVAAVAVLGFNAGGFFKSSTLVGRQYAYFLNTHIQAIMAILMLIIPFLVYPLTANNTDAEWSVVFMLWATLIICCGVWFAVRGSGQPAGFTGSPAWNRQQELQPVNIQPAKEPEENNA
ncbi:MFS domain-containing protein [Aphelenchoides bicaudatus]|nr:MFS domain-containing protein [Aphelenchoides bicaudatus]